jgi:hypothetical protein
LALVEVAVFRPVPDDGSRRGFLVPHLRGAIIPERRQVVLIKIEGDRTRVDVKASVPVATDDPGVTRFCKDYWLLASDEFPQLRMKEPGPTPKGSDWRGFPTPQRGRRIWHKFATGAVDLQLAEPAEMVEEIAKRNPQISQGGFEVVRTSKSASVRAKVPIVYLERDFSSQLEAVRAGLSAASKLLALSESIR